MKGFVLLRRNCFIGQWVGPSHGAASVLRLIPHADRPPDLYPPQVDVPPLPRPPDLYPPGYDNPDSGVPKPNPDMFPPPPLTPDNPPPPGDMPVPPSYDPDKIF